MSAGFLYTQNNTAQTVAVGGTINMGTVVRRKGCVCGSGTPYATANGATTTLSNRGRCPEYFKVDATFVVTPTAAGTVTINAVQDGVNVGAVGTATVVAADTTVTIPVVFGVRLNQGVTSSNITYVLSGAASTVNNVSQTVERID